MDFADLAATDDMRKTSAAIWRRLDALAAADPQAYERYIQQVSRDAANLAKTSRADLAPGFCIRTRPADAQLVTSQFYVNLAATTRLPAPPANDPLNIPIYVSEFRVAKDKTFRTVDVLVNTSIIARARECLSFRDDLIALAIGCIQETHSVHLAIDKHTSIEDNEYKKIEEEEKIEVHKNAPEDEKEATAGISTLHLPAPKTARTSAHGKNIIQVVAESSDLASWQIKKGKDGTSVVYCKLPGVKTQSEVDISYKNSTTLVIVTNLHKLEIPLDFLPSNFKCTAKFIVKSESLKLKFSE
ncbi:PIH1 domain-containing protein 2 [Entophlyctis luteolus]|nr:PIH1 domain-containing protein 2 [Entophlyctis luteolus]